MTIVVALIVLGVLVFYRQQIIFSIVSDVQLLRNEPKKWMWQKWKDWGEPFVVAIILALAIRTFLVGPYKIPTGSMEKTLMIGDRIFVDKLTYRFREPKRGEVIVFKFPGDANKFREIKIGKTVLFKYPEPGRDFVKRLIAFGGEEVEIRDGSVYINGEKLTVPNIASKYYYNRDDWEYGRQNQIFRVPANSLFVLGDNSGHSSDSRNWGFVPRNDLIGRAVVIWWPLNRISSVQ